MKYQPIGGLSLALTDVKNLLGFKLADNETTKRAKLDILSSGKRYVLYISQNYSFEILRPIQQQIIARGDSCAWFVEGEMVNFNNY